MTLAILHQKACEDEELRRDFLLAFPVLNGCNPSVRMGGHMRAAATALLIFSGLLAPSHALAQQSRVTGPVSGALSNVCHLSTQRRTWRGETWNNGSAILYRGRYLITAAHNMFSVPTSSVVKASVACGKADPSEAEHIEIDLAQVRVAAGYRWVPSKRFSRDFAVIKLPAAIETGTPMELFSGPLPAGPLPIELAGFPGRDDEAGGMDGWHMFKGSGTATPARRKPFLYYDFRSEKGNSGGPVWTMVGTTPTLVGIHVRGGGARIVDEEFVDEVNRMISDLDGATP